MRSLQNAEALVIFARLGNLDNKLIALKYASKKGNDNVVIDVIVQTQSDPEYVNARNKVGFTAVVLAAFEKQYALVRRLCTQDYADANIPDYSGHTALMFAITQDSLFNFLFKSTRKPPCTLKP